MAVDVVLHIHTHRAGALVQDGKLRLVVEQSRHLGPQQTHLKVCIYLGSAAKHPPDPQPELLEMNEGVRLVYLPHKCVALAVMEMLNQSVTRQCFRAPFKQTAALYS